jgi:hypothetical protein
MGCKRGQVTIFIIIAVVIVAVGIFLYMIFPSIKTNLGVQQQNPNSFIQTCLEKDIKDNIALASVQGGSIIPQAYTVFGNNKIEYLCYTNQYYRNCVVQQPMLKQHIETELKTSINSVVSDCFDSLQSSYESQGYQVNIQRGQFNVELLPKRVVTNINYSLTLTKTGTQKYDSFSVVVNNNLYELIAIANSIVEWEATYGKADVSIYMVYYHDLQVEKKTKADSTKIYIIQDLSTGNSFEFASRSQAWPGGVPTTA